MQISRVVAASVFAACLVAMPETRADGDDTFEVDFDNQATFSVTVYLNGSAVCNLAAGASCTQDLSSSTSNYAVHFVASTGSTSDDHVGPNACDEADVPTFTIYDDHVHFGCEAAFL